jgi:glyoxylase-like metal-dependent hydrolase (beta-lactamase superfamily II)
MSSQPLLEVQPIAGGLWRWTAPHPEWTPEKDRPGGWPRMVGSIYCEPPPGEPGPVVLVDPLAPPAGTPEAATFWNALDRDIERLRLPVVIVIANGYHARGALEFQERYAGSYGAGMVASAEAVARLGFPRARVFGAAAASLAGVEAFPVEGLDAGETALFIRRHRALVFADAVLGAGGGRLAVAPLSWAAEGEAAARSYRERFRVSLARLVDLDPAIVLPSHGEPVLAGGRAALAAALAGPAWGERAGAGRPE